MKRIWKAKISCQMPWRDFERGETIELDDKDVTERVKALFTCMTPDGGTIKQEKKDPDLEVMVARLKAAKIPMKKNITPKQIRELFDQFLGSGATAGAVSGEASGETQEPPKEDKPNEDKPKEEAKPTETQEPPKEDK